MTTWQNLRAAANSIMTECLHGDHSSGGEVFSLRAGQNSNATTTKQSNQGSTDLNVRDDTTNSTSSESLLYLTQASPQTLPQTNISELTPFLHYR